MSSSRESLIKLAGLGSSALVALAAHHVQGETAGMVGGGIALLGMVAEASFGHLGLETVHGLAKRFGGAKTARSRENRDLHRLIGETIAHILEESIGHVAGDSFVSSYLKQIAQDFRGEQWMNVQLTGPETAVSEEDISNYFSGSPEAIKRTSVLEKDEWVALFGKVYGGPTQIIERQQALDFAANELRQHFAFELWESVKHAWKKGDLAWPALVLRVLSELLRRANVSAEELPKLRNEIASLRDAIIKRAEPMMAVAPPSDAILVTAIHKYQVKITAHLNRIEGKLDCGVAEIRSDIADLRANLAPSGVEIDVDLRVWDRDNTLRFGAKVDGGAALPLRSADPFSITVRVNTPAYVYAVWLGSHGKVQPLHPWIKGEWNNHKPLAPACVVELPGRIGDVVKTWSIDTREGFETLVVMVREESLGDLSTRMYHDLPNMFPRARPTPMLPESERFKPIWSEFRQDSSVQPERSRVLFKESTVQDAMSQVLRLHQALRDRLGPYFSALKVGSFANVGEGLR